MNPAITFVLGFAVSPAAVVLASRIQARRSYVRDTKETMETFGPEAVR